MILASAIIITQGSMANLPVYFPNIPKHLKKRKEKGKGKGKRKKKDRGKGK